MKAIIFDFDGVLADTYNFNMNLAKEVVGYNFTCEDFKAHHDGNVFEQPKIIFTKESANTFFINYFNRITKVKPFFSSDNIKILVDIYPLYIVSSNDEKSILKFLKYNKLDYFKEILGVNFHKSKIEKFKYLFKKYDLKPEEVVFISDTLGDILEAKKVNVKTIAVDFGFHDRQRLKRGNPFKIVSNFEEILKVIKNM